MPDFDDGDDGKSKPEVENKIERPKFRGVPPPDDPDYEEKFVPDDGNDPPPRNRNGNGEVVHGRFPSSLPMLDSPEFITGFKPPEYLMDGLFQRGFLYAITGKTGSGKTAIMLRMMAHCATKTKLFDREVPGGKVLYLAGENADDVRMRWIALAQHMGFDPRTIEVFFIPQVFKISQHLALLASLAKQRSGEVACVMVDTSAAYFEGVDENNNKEAGDHARLLRKLCELPGRPCVIVACHPTKSAADDNLIPRGGGAFLNEIDGNLGAKSSGNVVELSVQGKFRGPEFEPFSFELKTVTHEQLKDTRGRLLPTVVAYPLTETGVEDREKVQYSREDEIMIALSDPANAYKSLAELAHILRWYAKDGTPYKMLVKRTLAALERQKLVEKFRRWHRLTKKGREAVDAL